MSEPRFSVVIPLYDKGTTILATLASVRAQTCPAIEIIVVDDESHDGGDDVVETLGDPHIRLIRQANGGPAAARNTGVAAAHGNWIALIDGDDLWHPHHLATLVEVIAAVPDAALVSSASRTVLPGEPIADVPMMATPPRRIDFFRDHRPDLLNASSVAIRRDAYLGIGGMPPVFPGEDMAFWIALAVDHAMAVSDRATSFYVRGDGIMAREQAARQAGEAMPLSPVFAAIDRAVATIADPARRVAATAFGDRTRLQYVRSELYAGRPADARRLLAGVVDRGGGAYRAYRALALLPGGILRFGMIARRLLRR
ncbi:glycosyltransferase family 2 protein [Sphingomonas sp. Leaf4]|uniref:glycosyltransferase family 2 protein n=1 Tax=Sphingomonas sp. Leaf4 TaxID=2876553 RepID=UPI001E503B0F|nr:glycosyltransferase family A protein [Sphingomonas sp. Leaf4]